MKTHAPYRAHVVAGIFGQGAKAQIEKLEERIRTLERELQDHRAEAERLRTRSARDDERRREAVAARQQADERANRLEDRLAQLEGDLERLRENAEAPATEETSPPRQERLRGRRLELFLDRLETYDAAPRGAFTATVHDEPPEEVSRLLGQRAALTKQRAPCLVLMDDVGLVSLALRPPVLDPIEPRWEDRFHLEREWFEPSGRFAFVLARANLFAAGVYEGNEQVSFKGFHPRVGRRHSKGGFSQGRFERIREEQIADHIKRCRETLQEFLGDIKILYLVGQRETVDALAKDFKPKATMNVDATGQPRPALDEAFETFWTTQLQIL